jgi:putative oxidoreductase
MSNSVILLVSRILLAVMFILAGFGKLTDPGTVEAGFSTVGMIAGRGLPAPLVLAYLAGLVELLGGLAVLVGFQTRIASWALALFCVASGVLFHMGATGDAMMDTINSIMLMKNLAIAGGFLALSIAGAGALSVDARRG